MSSKRSRVTPDPVQRGDIRIAAAVARERRLLVAGERPAGEPVNREIELVGEDAVVPVA
ncbi:MAG: hypothetical protein ACLP0J_19595 [Solirubrobacteraceae bacterium]